MQQRPTFRFSPRENTCLSRNAWRAVGRHPAQEVAGGIRECGAKTEYGLILACAIDLDRGPATPASSRGPAQFRARGVLLRRIRNIEGGRLVGGWAFIPRGNRAMMELEDAPRRKARRFVTNKGPIYIIPTFYLTTRLRGNKTRTYAVTDATISTSGDDR